MTESNALIDVPRLTAWLDSQALESGRKIEVERIAAGASNEMFRIRRGGADWVLRRPSGVAGERVAEGMRREFRLLSAVAPTAVPSPDPIALCEDESVLGCVFYLMEAIEGYAPIDPLPPEVAASVDRQRDVAFAMVKALASLHDVDWRAAGLEDFGRPDGFHERQVGRWTRQLASYQGREIPGIEAVGEWLESHIPASWSPTLMHGDYHMLNVLMAPGPVARVSAILDWETATIGDPMLDLAGFLRIWCPLHPVPWPSWDELVAYYEKETGRAVPDLRYYIVLYHFRLCVLLEGVYQRSFHDPTRQTAEQAGEVAMANARDAIYAIEAADPTRSES